MTSLAAIFAFQAAVAGYSADISTDSEKAAAQSASDEVLSDVEYLESSEVSEQFASENDPLYKKYMNGSSGLAAASARDASSKVFGIKTPQTPDIQNGYDSMYGIDVSMYQAYSTAIDWTKAKNDGVKFAIIRVGYRGYGSSGTIVKDSYFDQNIQGALKAGIPVGVYFYTQAISNAEAKQEANFVINAIKNYDITLPVFYDIESVSGDEGRLDNAGLSKAQKTNLCISFSDTVQSAGYTAGIYANKDWLTNYIDGKALAEKYDIWLAHYTNDTDYSEEFVMWQFSSSGSVSGIKGSVDLNILYFRKPHKITSISVSDSANGDPTSATLKWTRSAGSYRYQVKIYDDSAQKWVSLGTTNSNSFALTDLKSKVTYQYKVRGFRLINGERIYAPYSSVVSYVSPTTKVTGLKQTAASAKAATFSWNKLSTADGYYIYLYDKSSKTWKLIDTYSGHSKLSKKISGLDSGVSYKVRVKGYSIETDGTKKDLIVSDNLKIVTKPPKVTGFKHTKITDTSVTFSWNSLKVGSGYQIRVLDTNTGKYKTVATISGKSKTSYTLNGLASGKAQKYRIRGFKTGASGVKYAGEASDVYQISTKVAKVSNYKVSFSGKNGTLKWSRPTGAKGYQVQKKNSSGKWVTVKNISGKKNSSYSFKLKKNKTAVFRVRAYKSIKGKTNYGSWAKKKVVNK